MTLSVLQKLGVKNIEIKKSLADQLAASSGKPKEDPRILNYYDMRFGEKMKVLFLPSANGEFFRRAHVHGRYTDTTKRMTQYACPRLMLQEECSICENMFDLYKESKALLSDNPAMSAKIKKLANRMQTTEIFMIQCIVLETPVALNQTDDGNEVRILLAPRAIRDEIEKTLNSGEITEETFSQFPFVIHKQKRPNTDFAEYGSSLFSRNPVTEAELSYFEPVLDANGNVVEEAKVAPYDYDDLADMIPDMLTNSVVGEEWCQALVEAVEEDENGGGKKGDASTTNNRIPAAAQTQAQSPQPRQRVAPAVQTTPEYDEDVDDQAITENYIQSSVEESPKQEAAPAATGDGSSIDAIRNRIANRRATQ